ncbi:hypothetical protein ZWY2020_014969 [Hordeum vulgare]|nr:hypothetical protein ZWY2020_014969 [Hordeum vulgare]
MTFAAADGAAAEAETTATPAAMAAANAESARVAFRAADVALARVKAIHANIEDAHTKIFQGILGSSMQPTSEKAAEAMKHMVPPKIAERELEMQEAAEIEEHREEELCGAKDEVEELVHRGIDSGVPTRALALPLL